MDHYIFALTADDCMIREPCFFTQTSTNKKNKIIFMDSSGAQHLLRFTLMMK